MGIHEDVLEALLGRTHDTMTGDQEPDRPDDETSTHSGDEAWTMGQAIEAWKNKLGGE